MDGLFEKIEGDTAQDPSHPQTSLRFHEATALTRELLEGLQQTVRKRVLRHFRRHGLLEPHDTEDMLGWEHGGGFSLDASVRIEATDREGLERLIRYCARPPFALERLHLVGGRSLAFKWIRIIFRCWHDGIGYDEQHYLNALRRRGSPLAQRLQPTPRAA